VDEEGRTSITHVFAGDDIATGVATIILAMGTAKTAAQAIDRMLKKD
jgi:glutamate synthase (NADPH/NADH) small chain